MSIPLGSATVAPGFASGEAEAILASMVRWLERAVIGLNLCPFAKSVHVKGQIHYRLSDAIDRQQVLDELKSELRDLADIDPQVRDTTLLIVPRMFSDFYDFHAFVDRAERCLRQLDLEGVLQIAHFHPQFEFAGTDPDDITNYTNRAPYAVLHLIREESIDRAVEAIPDAETIYERNMQTMRALGESGWEALGLGAAPVPVHVPVPVPVPDNCSTDRSNNP